MDRVQTTASARRGARRRRSGEVRGEGRGGGRRRRGSPCLAAQHRCPVRGTPPHGRGIDRCRPGARCPRGWRRYVGSPGVVSPSSWRSLATSAVPPFGVVAFWQPHVPSMFAGIEVWNELPEKQLFTDCMLPKAPPSRPMSAPPARVPLFTSLLFWNRLPETWKKMVVGPGGNGCGYSCARIPKLTL